MLVNGVYHSLLCRLLDVVGKRFARIYPDPGAASVITHQLSLKGKAAADVAEVAKHLNITYDVRDTENAGGIAECSHIMEFTV